MSSSSGNSSGTISQPQNSGSDEDLQTIMDTRKRKRMISNRESARRSRMKKQKHLDDLLTQANRLREENNQILTSLNLTTQLFLNVEAENSVIRAQVTELSHRLKSLCDITNCLNGSTNDITAAAAAATPFFDPEDDGDGDAAAAAFSQVINSIGDYDFLDPWNLLNVNQPIMASPDVFLY